MRLSRALRLGPGQAVAFTGAGGKSSAIRVLVNELQFNTPVIVTTSTKIGLAQSDLAEEHLLWDEENFEQLIDTHLHNGISVLVTHPQVQGEPKWQGLNLHELDELKEMSERTGATMLIEADGARMKLLKAPGDHEPVVPDWVDLVVPMAGLDVIGKPFTSEHCHRADRARGTLRIEGETAIEERHVSQLLRSPSGGLQGVPPTSRIRVFLRQGENPGSLETGRRIASDLLTSDRIQSVLIGTLEPDRPVEEAISRTAGIVLAAGSSKRLEGLKQLLSLKGKPFIAWVVEAALEGGLDPINVVVGDNSKQIKEALQGYEVKFLENPDPEKGQASSLKVGVRELSPTSEAAIFLLADMPLIRGDLVAKLVERHHSTLSPIVMPHHGGKRGNPVLFDRVTFAELMRIQGDKGGRVIFSEFPHEQVEWDDSIHFDVDTPEDLDRLRGLE